MKDIDHNKLLERMKAKLDSTSYRLRISESSSVEFKESFNWGSKSKYAKSMAAFANNKGGYLIFGVADRPRTLVGLSSERFDNIDEADVTAYLNGLFSPEIVYEKFIEDIAGRPVGFVYTYQSEHRPVIATKMDGDIREAEVYYRYNARNDKIKYPELKKLLDVARENERQSWADLFARISQIGPVNTGIMDIVNGTVEGKGGTLLIDEELLSKIKFIKEGRFAEKGSPILRLVGDVHPVHVTKAKEGQARVRLTDDPTAIAVREEDIRENYPFTYSELVEKLSNRYSDFKTNQRFHEIRKDLMRDDQYCRTRYLDPEKRKGTKKDFYSTSIIKEFDKHYTKKQTPKKK